MHIPNFFRTFARYFAYMRTNGKKHIVFWLFLLLLPVGLWGQEVKPLPMPSSSKEAVELAHPVIEPEKDSDTVVRHGDRTSIIAGGDVSLSKQAGTPAYPDKTL